jgi:hypothetical protein
MPNKVSSGNGVIMEIYHVSRYEELSFINNSHQCYSENEDSEEAIVEQISLKHQKTSETDEDDMTERERVTNQDARKFISELLLNFMHEGNEGSAIPALET